MNQNEALKVRTYIVTAINYTFNVRVRETLRDYFRSDYFT